MGGCESSAGVAALIVFPTPFLVTLDLVLFVSLKVHPFTGATQTSFDGIVGLNLTLAFVSRC